MPTAEGFPRLATRFVGYPPEAYFRDWRQSLDPRVTIVPNAVVLPLRVAGSAGLKLHTGVYDSGGRVIVDAERAKLNRSWSGSPIRQLGVLRDRSTFRRLTGRAFYAGHLRPAFGHVLLEVLPRLWPDLDFAAFDHVIVHRTHDDRDRWPPLPRFAMDLLERRGIGARQLVVVDEPLLIDQLVVSTPAIVLRQAFDPVARDAFRAVGSRDDLRGHVTADTELIDHALGGRRLYFSRRRITSNDRIATNERALERLASRWGCEIVHPQELAIRDQIEVVRTAELVVGCDGSALHLLVFARPGTRLLAIDSRVVDNQLIVDQMCGIDAWHVLAAMDGPQPRDGAWTIDLELVRATAEEVGLW